MVIIIISYTKVINYILYPPTYIKILVMLSKMHLLKNFTIFFFSSGGGARFFLVLLNDCGKFFTQKRKE